MKKGVKINGSFVWRKGEGGYGRRRVRVEESNEWEGRNKGGRGSRREVGEGRGRRERENKERNEYVLCIYWDSRSR